MGGGGRRQRGGNNDVEDDDRGEDDGGDSIVRAAPDRHTSGTTRGDSATRCGGANGQEALV